MHCTIPVSHAVLLRMCPPFSGLPVLFLAEKGWSMLNVV